jgi:sec-independent protein translocase protein TatC
MLDKAIERRNKDAVMGLGEHLDDLRRRVIYALIGIVPVLAVAIAFGQELFQLCLRPVQDALAGAGEPAVMIAPGVLEGFGGFFKVCLVATLIVGGPWVIYQLWLFIAPGLYKQEKRFAQLLAPFSTLMAIGGVTFGYLVVLPLMLGFLVQFNAKLLPATPTSAVAPAGVVLASTPILDNDPPDATPGQMWVNRPMRELRIAMKLDDKPDSKVVVMGMPLVASALQQQFRVSDSLDFVLFTLGAMALGFQTPVVVLVLGWAGIVDPKMLGKLRKHAFAGSAIAAAILTPSPDPVSMMILAIPMYLLYELGVLLLILLPAWRVAGRKRPEPIVDEQPGGGADGP